MSVEQESPAPSSPASVSTSTRPCGNSPKPSSPSPWRSAPPACSRSAADASSGAASGGRPCAARAVSFCSISRPRASPHAAPCGTGSRSNGASLTAPSWPCTARDSPVLKRMCLGPASSSASRARAAGPRLRPRRRARPDAAASGFLRVAVRAMPLPLLSFRLASSLASRRCRPGFRRPAPPRRAEKLPAHEEADRASTGAPMCPKATGARPCRRRCASGTPGATQSWCSSDMTTTTTDSTQLRTIRIIQRPATTEVSVV